MMKRYNCIFMALVALALFACQGRKTASGDGGGGDTLKMKYARNGELRKLGTLRFYQPL